MNFIILFLEILGFVFFAYFAFSAIYLIIFAIAGHFYQNIKYPESIDKIRKIGILVPAYKEDNVIVGVAEFALKQDYKNFELIIIADSFKEVTLEKLRKLPLTLLEIINDKRTKANAINMALNQLPTDYDVILILDGDNIIQDSDFLTKINQAFSLGNKIVQGHRTAKNFNTNFALLDGISEEINNHIFRKGHRAIGLSSALIGSAMAFEYNLFKKYMKEIKTSGEDKELEFNFLKDGYHFEYLDDAIVLDEKTQKSDAFVKQRSRWLANQFLQAQLHFLVSIKALLKGNIDFFDKALQHFLLPRILLLGTTFLISIILIIFNYSFAFLWFFCFLIILLSLLISIPKRFINTKTLIAILSLPKGYISMILSMLHMKGATKNFVVTEKNYNQDNK